ncbi:metal ABC transporter solute-binding protein, Zn/Mn family [Paraliobacillus ryukyuensis]|uniref:metal ABC transporter solute-binding protein, Zn/Mn family n=1 Tax=Paraliobacillus ryukyuensis TaxID=200904 RepID=UPI0009A884B8|nr:zinc ABC transporter substrate-binding protein [Paraliobacillus ryukyuensis]
MNKRWNIIAVLGIIAILILGACGGQAAEESASNESESNTDAAVESNEETLQVYTTLYPLAYFANEIGGDHVNAESILPLGADAHTYEPTSKTMVDIAEADAFIYNGAGMEAYAESITDALSGEDVSILEASEGISLIDHSEEHAHGHEEEGHDHAEGEDHGHEEEGHDHAEEGHHHHGDKDPHIWLDPIRAISLAENIKNTLVELQPDSKDEFEANFEDLKTRLEELDTDFHNTLESAPRNEILVTHAGYGYWANAYGIEQLAISGLSPSNEPSQKKLQELVDTVKEHNIRYLLFEQNVEPKVARVIQDETNVESLYIHNLSVLTEEDVDNNEDYFTLMNRNLETLETALQE